MTFKPASVPSRAPSGGAVSADNIPPRHVVIDMLRRAALPLGLTPPVLATLDTLLSCLAPQRDHHCVFASNQTLLSRRNGISERTLRRHFAELVKAGLLIRRDSANRKRFTRRNSQTHQILRFGFDLSPLYERLAELSTLAVEEDKRRETIRFLKARVRAAVADILRNDPEHVQANILRNALRRNLDAETLTEMLDQMPEVPVDNLAEQADKAAILTGYDGQNVRHQQNSNKDNFDKESQVINIDDLLLACPDAIEFSSKPIRTAGEVIEHGQILAPMLGIAKTAYVHAVERLGREGTALTIWALVQMQPRLRNVAAYFHALTQGTKSASFSPYKLILGLLGKAQAQIPIDKHRSACGALC